MNAHEAESVAGDWQAHDAPAAGVEWGVRFLPPHANAGFSVWMPDVFSTPPTRS